MSSSTTTPKPVYIIAPGLGQTPIFWSSFISSLHTLGHEAVAIAWPTQSSTPLSSSTSPSAATQADEISALSSLISHYVDTQQRDVVLLAHSYGGIPASRAATAFEKSVRLRQGHRTGVVGLVFLSAAILPEGAEAPDFRPDWLEEKDGWFKITDEGVPIQFHDVPEEEHARWVAETKWQRVAAGDGPLERAVWGLPVPKTYIVTIGDRAWSPQMQLQQVEGVVDETWTVRTIQGGHNPFLVRPDELARLVVLEER